MIIKVFLVASILVGCHWLLAGQRHAGRLALTRMAGPLLAAGWILAVLDPGSVTRVARLVGVGRGTDLVVYVTVVAFMFTAVLQQRRTRDLEQRIVTLTRAHALLAERSGQTPLAPDRG